MPGTEAELRIAVRAVNEARTALREVQRDIAELEGAVGRANGRFAALDVTVGALGSSMQTVGRGALLALGGGIAAIGGGLGLALRSSADFHRVLTAVAAISGATADELQGLRRTALDLGQSTAFSASQVLQAMEVLAANGITARDIIDGAAKASVILAAAGGTSLVQAADTVSTAMAVWGLSTATLTDTVNRLAGAANVSRFGVEDMSLAIAQGGGAAAAAGVEFEDYAAAIAAVSPFFASGADAGTSFKAFITRLTPASREAAEAMRRLGIITADGTNRFFDASGRLKDMDEIVGILHESLAGLSEEDRTALLSQAFGADGMRTVIGLSRMTREELAELQQQMGATSAEEIAAQRMQGLAGAWEQFRGALETARIEIGDRLSPVLTRLVGWLADQIPRVTQGVLGVMDRLAADVIPRVRSALDDIRAAWDRVREPVMQILGSQEALQIGLGLLAAVLLSVAVAAGSMAVGLLAAVAPVAALGLAIGGIIILAAKMGVDWGRVWDGVRAVVGRVVDAVAPRIAAFVEGAAALLRRFGVYVDAELRPALERVAGWIGAVLERVLPIIRPIVEGWIAAFRRLAETNLEVVGTILQIVGRLVDVVVQLINGDWSSAWDSAKEVVRLAIHLVVTLIEGFVGTIADLAGGLLEAGRKLLGALAAGAQAAWTDVVWPWLQGVPGMVKDALAGAGEWLVGIGEDILRGLLRGMQAAWDEVSGWVGSLGGKIRDLKGPPEEDRVLLRDIGEMIIEGLGEGMADEWEGGAKQVVQAISADMVDEVTDAAEQARQVLDRIHRGMTGSTRDTLSTIAQLMRDNLKSGVELTVEEVRSLLDHMTDILASDQVPDAMRSLAERTIGALREGLEAGKGVANEAVADIADRIAAAMLPKNLTEAGAVDWARRGEQPPIGNLGRELVWDETGKAWVEPWMRGSVGTPEQRAAAWTEQQRALTVNLTIDGRTLAQATLPAILDEADRQGVRLT